MILCQNDDMVKQWYVETMIHQKVETMIRWYDDTLKWWYIETMSGKNDAVKEWYVETMIRQNFYILLYRIDYVKVLKLWLNTSKDDIMGQQKRISVNT